MILRRLAEHYDRVASDPREGADLPRLGYSRQKMSFCVVLNSDGSLMQIESLLDIEGSRVVPKQLLVPGDSKPSGSGTNPGFLWDNAAYMLGIGTDDTRSDDPQYLARVADSFADFRKCHLSVENEIDSGAFTAVCRFLAGWDPNVARAKIGVTADIQKYFGVFRLAGTQHWVHEEPAVKGYWNARHSAGEAAKQTGICLVTGLRGPIARLHEPKIKGVADGQSSGALLVSFNEDAYTSYGRDQGYTAPVSTEAAFKYSAALNWLLDRRDRRFQLGDATVVFWAASPTQSEGIVSDLLNGLLPQGGEGATEDIARRDAMRLFLSKLRMGVGPADTSLASGDEDDVPFWILGLSPNAARVSVRFWLETNVGELKSRLAQHVQDLELIGRRDQDTPVSVRRLVQVTGRARIVDGRVDSYDSDSVSPLLAGSIARAVLFDTPYPQSMLSALLGRIRADGAITHERIAGIKACIVRNTRIQGRPMEVSVSLDQQRSDPAYITGRLFSMLEKIQEDSSEGELNATIKDRFFSSASATPSVVFPRLIRLSQHHLARMDTGKKIWFEKQLQDAIGRLDRFKTQLSLEEQGLFAIGYYHQRQHFFAKKDTAHGNGEAL